MGNYVLLGCITTIDNYVLTYNTHLPSIYPRQLSINGCVNNFHIVPFLIYFDLAEMKTESRRLKSELQTLK